VYIYIYIYIYITWVFSNDNVDLVSEVAPITRISSQLEDKPLITKTKVIGRPNTNRDPAEPPTNQQH
jgi:hypothetical protein